MFWVGTRIVFILEPLFATTIQKATRR
jgi:hypothetical protein